MDHRSLPAIPAAVTPQAGVRVLPTDITRKCQTAARIEISPVKLSSNCIASKTYRPAPVTGNVSPDTASIDLALAAEGAALVEAMCARAEGRGV